MVSTAGFWCSNSLANHLETSLCQINFSQVNFVQANAAGGARFTWEGDGLFFDALPRSSDTNLLTYYYFDGGRHCIALAGNTVFDNQVLSTVSFGLQRSTAHLCDQMLSHSGLQALLESVSGAFALVIYDKQEKVLALARDRMGQQPLYWAWVNGSFVFSSELASFQAFEGFKPEVNRNALALFMRHGYVPAPWTILQGVNKLLPGSYLQLPLSLPVSQLQRITPSKYWSFNKMVEQGLAKPFSGSDGDAVDLLEESLTATISQQLGLLQSPGALLSGGIDSTLITALAQKCSSQPLATYTADTVGSGNDEAAYAEKIASLLGTSHTLLTIHPDDALGVAMQLPEFYTEPLSANSQILLVLLGQQAGKSVDGLFCGDGGDELFGGYNRYLGALQTWRRIQRLPKPVRRAAIAMLESISPGGWDALFARLGPVLPSRYRLPIWGIKAKKLAQVLRLDSREAYFRSLTSHWPNPADIVKGAQEPLTIFTDPSLQPETDCFEHWMMALDAQSFLQEEAVQKVNGALGSQGLQTFSPLFDHRVMALAWQMPLNKKIRNGEGKWLMRQLLYRHVPRELVDRPKRGFGIPAGEWLRGPLKPWADALLDRERLEAEGYFQAEPIVRLWKEHLSGKDDWQFLLWPVLMFQAWADRWLR